MSLESVAVSAGSGCDTIGKNVLAEAKCDYHASREIDFELPDRA